MNKLKMNCGYCGRKCDLDKDFCIPQDSVYVCKSCYDWQNRVADLEAKLAEKDKTIENWETMYRSVMQSCHNGIEEDKRLREQLAEQPKQIVEKIREKIVDYNVKYSSAVDVLNCLDLVLDNLLKEYSND